MNHRIMFIHGYADMYGSSRSLLRLTTNLSSSYEPLVLLAQHGPLVQELEKGNVKVIVCPWMYSNILGRHVFHGINLFWFFVTFLPNIIRLAMLFRRERVDLVHSNGIIQIVPAFAAKLTGTPHVWHVRETIDQYVKLWSQFAEGEPSLFWRISTYFALRLWPLFVRMIYLLSANVVCVSAAVRSPFLSLGLAQRTTVVHNGLEIDYYRAQAIEPLDVAAWLEDESASEYLFLGTVGALRQPKGQHILLRAFAKLCQMLPDQKLKCLLVGDAKPEAQSYVDSLHTIARDSGVEKDVIFYGAVPDPRPAFARLDVFVLPSVQAEPFGTVVLEAMTTETPLIATNIGGSAEQVEDGVSGLLIPPGDVDALAEALYSLIASPDLRKQLSENALERVQTLFTVEAHVKRMEQMYATVLGPATG